MAEISNGREKYRVNLGDTFFDQHSTSAVILMDAETDTEGRYWCADAGNGQRVQAFLPEGWALSRNQAVPEFLVNTVLQWGSQGEHSALYWLYRFERRRNLPKAGWFLVAAYRRMPLLYRSEIRTFFRLLKADESCYFLTEIPEHESLDIPIQCWKSALKKALSE